MDAPLPYRDELLMKAFRGTVITMLLEIGFNYLNEIGWQWKACVWKERVDCLSEVFGGAVRWSDSDPSRVSRKTSRERSWTPDTKRSSRSMLGLLASVTFDVPGRSHVCNLNAHHVGQSAVVAQWQSGKAAHQTITREGVLRLMS